jgi:hypothetical protein
MCFHNRYIASNSGISCFGPPGKYIKLRRTPETNNMRASMRIHSLLQYPGNAVFLNGPNATLIHANLNAKITTHCLHRFRLKTQRSLSIHSLH